MRIEKNNTAERELRFSRLLNAPVELVWEVWTKPEHIKSWWGPANFTATVQKMNVTENGDWDIVLRSPDGVEFLHHHRFKEIIKYKKIVFELLTHFRYTGTIEFEKRDDKTFISWHLLFESKEYLEEVARTIGVDTGFRQHSERFMQYLSSIISEQ